MGKKNDFFLIFQAIFLAFSGFPKLISFLINFSSIFPSFQQVFERKMSFFLIFQAIFLAFSGFPKPISFLFNFSTIFT
jgi:hypothetical protein